MIKTLHISLLVLATLVSANARNLSFIQNQGQWESDFDFKFTKGNTAVFLEGNALTVVLSDIDFSELHSEGIMLQDQPPQINPVNYHAYRVQFVGASQKPRISTSGQREEYHNYLIGNDPGKWREKVPLFEEVTYHDLYPGIDLRYYFSPEGNLKYDLIIHPGADPDVIELRYDGVDELKLSYGNLIVKNSIEDVLESAPFSYQQMEGDRERVDCKYKLDGNHLTFAVGKYNKRETLTIDPKLIFSSYIGSQANNFGYTATYSVDGGLYSGGIVYDEGMGYPVTVGAYQKVHQGGDIDVAISKFSKDGSTLIYSTYLGGTNNEMPYSLFESADKSLLILGSTGSYDFPMGASAYETMFKGGPARAFYGGNISINYNYGSDIFIAKLDSTGGSLLGSTFFGGTGNEGFNLQLNFNYGDYFRGEIIADSSHILIASTTFSQDLPTGINVFQDIAGGLQDGFVACFNNDLSQLNWSTYVGGPLNDHALGLKIGNASSLFVAGGTESDGLFPENGQLHDSLIGGVDGYVLSLGLENGYYQTGTYNGTVDRDVNYFVEIDFKGDVYVFGQTKGDYPISDSIFSNPGSAQYLNKFSPDLSNSLRSTCFGDGKHDKSNLSPTAFMVDDCRNVYLSGWGGGNNISHYNQGTTYGLPITDNAMFKNTDGQDFYFMVLDASWKKINYATYFGGSNDEHVDGGTSRFAKDGTIYQAVCAGCLGMSMFPTTPGAYSRTNGSAGCNLAVIKMQIESRECVAEIVADVDSSCIPYTANISNQSFNGDIYLWTLPDGTVVKGDITKLDITTNGRHDLQLIAIDTTCGFVDTTSISLYGFKDSVYANFEAEYDSCSNDFQVHFHNTAAVADLYFWDFGDGKTSNLPNPIHRYTRSGDFYVKLVTRNTYCDQTDSTVQKLSFKKRISDERFRIDYSPCLNGTNVSFTALGTDFQMYEWEFGDGTTGEGQSVEHDFSKAGTYKISLSLSDTICDRYLHKDTSFTVYESGYVPVLANVFTPNNDGQNDYFGFPPNLPVSYTHSYSLKVYNRWGTEVYTTDDIQSPWDGTTNGQNAAEGVYFYILNYLDDCDHQKTYNGYVHLSN